MLAARLSLPLGLALLRAAAATGVSEENVTYSDGNASLPGFIAYPAGATGQLPVVMHVHTWSGLTNFERDRARRTASELGLVGFAVSIYTENETAQAAAGMQAQIAQSYTPQLFASRLAAAMAYLRSHARANASMVAAAGYCFGGSAVLQYAKHGGASADGVKGVVSFHGGLSNLAAGNASFGDVKVLVYNGNADFLIPMSASSTFQEYMTNHSTDWEVVTYGRAQHGFTHPKESTAHFHFDQVAEERSWSSVSDFTLRKLGFDAVAQAPLHAVANASVSFSDGNTSLRGFVAYPTGASGRLPAIIHVHTWAGLTDFEKDRARRTAAEIGYVSLAMSVYTEGEEQTAQGGMQARIGVAQGYLQAPERFASRLSAATAFLKNHSLVDPSKIGIAGYCFGGTGVLQYARLGTAAADGVAGVVSFHGGLTGLDARPQKYCPTRVAIFNGAADAMITDSQITSLADDLEQSKTYWEFTNYSFADHGFTHPSDGSAHFHYEQSAEQRSWLSFADFFNATFDGRGRADPASCVHQNASNSSGPAPSGSCADDDAAVAAAAGSWGITSCQANLCTGQYAAMMRPLCMVTCGMCGGGGNGTLDNGSNSNNTMDNSPGDGSGTSTASGAVLASLGLPCLAAAALASLLPLR
mmetsp:Transcript_56686/g.181992  ORF Transcript_56686/g.181992 Transcript_56686/m.181992 type:complete len:642 (+) Transcript_56686:61-1986(+)